MMLGLHLVLVTLHRQFKFHIRQENKTRDNKYNIKCSIYGFYLNSKYL